MPLLNRLIWANLESLPRAIFEKIMVRLLAEPFLFKATADKLVRLNILNSLRSKPINLEVRLLSMANRSVHNAFHHEVVTFASKVKNDTLVHSITDRIAVLDNLMTANLIE